MKTAWGYIRVSREDERPENQLGAIERWAKEKGFEVTRWFEEKLGTSGAVLPMERPKFAEMMRAGQGNSKPECILVYELSRVGRTFRETLEAVWALEKLGIPLVSVSPKEEFLSNLDPSIRSLILAVFTWAAEREREMLIERTKAGLARARAEGKHLGRKPAFTPKEVEEMRYLHEVKGVSILAISKLKGAKYATVYKYLGRKK